MINLEWLRTFRAVYKTKSLSKASEMLNISQPTVSQHVQALEAHISKRLFVRKSKGVEETDDGRILNTLVSGSIEALEETENILEKCYSKENTIVSLGVSQHMFKTLLCEKLPKISNRVHVNFGTKQSLTTDVEEGKLLYAVVPDEMNTFDTICYPLFDQNLVLLKTKDVDLGNVVELVESDPIEAEKVLTNQIWYVHNSSSSYIKLFWIDTFDKKRPTVLPNYVIPNEFETLQQLSSGSGLTVALDTNAKYFLDRGLLEEVPLPSVFFRKMCLIANKKKAPQSVTERLVELLKS